MANRTPEEVEAIKERWRRAAAEEEAARPANVARDRRLHEALQEQSLSGELRRAVFDSGLDVAVIADQARVPMKSLADFMTGDAPLDTDAAGRIASVLNCHLVPSA